MQFRLLDCTVNYEIGHLPYGHTERRAAATEAVADSTGTDINLLGWGWWAEAGWITGLPDPVWALLGPTVFLVD